MKLWIFKSALLGTTEKDHGIRAACYKGTLKTLTKYGIHQLLHFGVYTTYSVQPQDGNAYIGKRRTVKTMRRRLFQLHSRVPCLCFQSTSIYLWKIEKLHYQVLLHPTELLLGC